MEKSASEREVICFCARMVLAAGEMVQRNQRLFIGKRKKFSHINVRTVLREKELFTEILTKKGRSRVKLSTGILCRNCIYSPILTCSLISSS